MKGIPST